MKNVWIETYNQWRKPRGPCTQDSQPGQSCTTNLFYYFTLCQVLFACIWLNAAEDAYSQTSELALPSEKQIRFADWEVGAFIHYGLNPFIDQEHGDGLEPPSKFNPTSLDAEQWVLTAKALGARYACLTARHEGGFCLWPSESTEYTIANSPYLDGKGDVVREFVDACRKHEMAVGLYHTAGFNAHEAIKDFDGYEEVLANAKNSNHPWGKGWALVGAAFRADSTLRDRFNAIQVQQFRELLSNYGPIDFMWSDHWNAGDPDGVWRAVTDMAEQLQPNMVMMGPDTWVPGNETGHVVYPMWNAVHTKDGTKYTRPVSKLAATNDYGLLENLICRGSPNGKFWRVRECTTHRAFHHGGWFWHPDHIKKTYPLEKWEHVDLYYRTVGLGANTIINLPPDTRGLIPDDIAAAAKAFGEEIRERFSTPIATTQTVQEGNVVELSWATPTKINTLVTMENIATGQKVAKYTLEAFVDGKWQALEPKNRLVAAPPYETAPGFETIGHKKIDVVSPVKTKRVRFRCLEAVAQPVELRSLAVYHCEPNIRTFSGSYPYVSGIDTTYEVAHGGMNRDVNYKGNPIRLGGAVYQRGILLCPVRDLNKGVAEFDLTEGPQRKAKGLTATVGIEDSTHSAGSVEFVVEGKIGSEWKELFKSATMRGDTPPLPIRILFPAGMTMLRLLTLDGGDGINSDHAMWADAKFTEEVDANSQL